jgi:hypothetical protein
MLDCVRDPSTGHFLGPVDGPTQEEALELFYAIPQNIPESDQDAQLQAHLGRLLTAVVDTGVLHEHPLIRGRVVGDADLTGEGPEDRHGHGTVVALLVSGVRFWPLLNVKVIPAAGYGSKKALVRALGYIRDYKLSQPDRVLIAVVSLGIYSRRWLFLRCRGGCSVCKAARRLGDVGVGIAAAAGNTPGRTACPATVAVQGLHDQVSAVEAPDVPTSGIGTVPWTGRPAPFVPID